MQQEYRIKKHKGIINCLLVAEPEIYGNLTELITDGLCIKENEVELKKRLPSWKMIS